MENSNNIAKVIGALALGAVIGGTIGILFAPAKGSETRKKLSSKGEDLGDLVKQKFGLLVEEVKKEVSSAKERANGRAAYGPSLADKLNAS